MKIKNSIKISFILPIYNESKRLSKNILILLKFCKLNNISPEIIICDNGSTDKTKFICDHLKSDVIKIVTLKQRAFGAAYKEGILNAKSDLFYFSGIDFPFGLNNILDSLRFIDKYDIVYSSKAHPDSHVRISYLRRIMSTIYERAILIVLGLKIRDPQGCIMADRKKILKIIDKCDSPDFFFSTQIAIYSQHSKYRTIEIPVTYLKQRSDSKINIAGDSYSMVKQIFKEAIRLYKHKKEK